MKSLVDFIKENYIAESKSKRKLVMFKFNKDLSQVQANVEDGLFSFLNLADRKYSFNNRTDVNKFWKDYLKFTKLTEDDLYKLKIKDDEDFARLIIDKKDKLEEQGFKLSVIKSFDESERVKEYKAWTKSKEYVKGSKLEDLDEDGSEEELERTLVVYYSKNPMDKDYAMYFPFYGKRGKKTDKQVNMIKMEWHYETGLNYYDARPILLVNYRKKTEQELAKREYWSDDDLA